MSDSASHLCCSPELCTRVCLQGKTRRAVRLVKYFVFHLRDKHPSLWDTNWFMQSCKDQNYRKKCLSPKNHWAPWSTCCFGGLFLGLAPCVTGHSWPRSCLIPWQIIPSSLVPCVLFTLLWRGSCWALCPREEPVEWAVIMELLSVAKRALALVI